MVNSKNSTKNGYARSLEEIEMILDNIPGLVFYKDDKNNLIRVNKYFADAHKTTKDKLAGKNCFDIYPKDEAQKYLDDDESTCKTLAFIFNKKGYNVETVGTGHEALEIVRNKSFNLALLDIKLPDVEGIELLLPLKKMHPDMETMMTPIVLLKP